MMQYYCSGGRFEDPITEETCLGCARELGCPPCGFSYPVLKSIFATRDDRSEEVHVTDLIGCLRKAYYTKSRGEIKFVHEIMSMWVGIAVHNQIEKDLADDPYFETEVPVGTGSVEGRIDLIERGTETIYDLKTTAFLNPNRQLPYGNHAEQVNLYREMANLAGPMFIQYLSTTGATKCRKHRVPLRLIDGVVQCPICGYTVPSANLGAFLVSVEPMPSQGLSDLRAAELQAALDNQVVPEAEPGWLCSFCAFTDICPESMEAS